MTKNRGLLANTGIGHESQTGARASIPACPASRLAGRTNGRPRPARCRFRRKSPCRSGTRVFPLRRTGGNPACPGRQACRSNQQRRPRPARCRFRRKSPCRSKRRSSPYGGQVETLPVQAGRVAGRTNKGGPDLQGVASEGSLLVGLNEGLENKAAIRL